MTKKKENAEMAIRDIRRATRRQYSAEEKIQIVLDDYSRYTLDWCPLTGPVIA